MLFMSTHAIAQSYSQYFDGNFVYGLYSPGEAEIGVRSGFGTETSRMTNAPRDLVIPSKVKDEGDEYIVSRIASLGFTQEIQLAKVTMPNSITNIGYLAFNDCPNLQEVVYSENLDSICRDAFGDCRSLKKIVLPGKLRVILNNAFEDCSNLTSVTIPGSLRMMGQNVFKDCKNLTTITVNQYDPIPIFDNDFSDYTHQHARLIVPMGCADKYRNTKGWDLFVNIKEAATGIDAISTDRAADSNSSAAYNLAGQKVSDGYKGIVIKNEKKILVK